MPTHITVPELGESVVEATVAKWLKQEGDRVEVGEPVVELETEKVDLEVGATRRGVLVRIVRGDGQDVKIGEVLGVIEETTEPDRVAPVAAPPVSTPPAPASEARIRSTASARRVAEDHAIDLEEVRGSGDGGRVTRRDVERHVDQRETPRAEPSVPTAEAAGPLPAPGRAAAAPAGGPERAGLEERVRMSRRRQTIARRLVEAQRTAAMLTTFNEVDMSAVQRVRQRHRERFRQQHGVGLGPTSFFVKATVAALKRFPRLNAEIQGSEMVLKRYYDIGVAVGAEEGLVVPVLADADRLSFAEIEIAIKNFAKKAEAGALTLEDLRGGTFTITNGGVFGSLLSTPILNPPQVGILGLHKIQDRAVSVDGQVAIRPMMYVALSYDHRIVDGLDAVQFLVRVKALVEEPESMLFE